MPVQARSSYDEESALLPEKRCTNQNHQHDQGQSSSPKRTRAERGVSFNRAIIYLLIIALVLTNIKSRRSFQDVNAQLKSSQQKMEEIFSTLSDHDEVIHRFNSSITNSDVIERMADLERGMNDTAARLSNELAVTKTEVTRQLNSTVQQLSETVTLAEQEISDEVEKVKKDVEHYVVTTQDQFSLENSFMVYQLAGTFTLLSCLISMWHMTAHLRKMNQPDVQRKILAILWMSPIYAVTSWFSLVFHSAEGYLAIIKDGYEAYIIYQFLSFCISVIGRGDRDVVVDVLARHADHLTPPFRITGVFEMCGCCKPKPYANNRALADAILLQCQAFAMQFVLFRPLTTTAMVVLKNLDYYGMGESATDYRSPQFYITIVQNLSIFVAFTGLLKFYHAVDMELAWCRPLAKFLCIKGVVFMTFWQGLCISVLAQTTDVAGEDKEEWALSAQNFLICLEMLLFSIAHFYCFPTEEWQDGYRLKAERSAFGDTIALGDFFQDVKLILTSGGHTKGGGDQHSTKSRRRRRKSSVVGASSSRSVASGGSVGVTHRKSSLRKKPSRKSLQSEDLKTISRISLNDDVHDEEKALLSGGKSTYGNEIAVDPNGEQTNVVEEPQEITKHIISENKTEQLQSMDTPVRKNTTNAKHEQSGSAEENRETEMLDNLKEEQIEEGEGGVERFIDENIHDDSEEEESTESEGDDDESTDSEDEGDGYTDTTHEDLTADQQFVKKALKRSLGSAGDDPDIKEATRRLLESRVLSPEFFLGSEASIEFPDGFNSGADISDDDEEGELEAPSSHEDGDSVATENDSNDEDVRHSQAYDGDDGIDFDYVDDEGKAEKRESGESDSKSKLIDLNQDDDDEEEENARGKESERKSNVVFDDNKKEQVSSHLETSGDQNGGFESSHSLNQEVGKSIEDNTVSQRTTAVHNRHPNSDESTEERGTDVRHADESEIAYENNNHGKSLSNQEEKQKWSEETSLNSNQRPSFFDTVAKYGESNDSQNDSNEE